MATVNISLPDKMKTWIKTRLEDGQFGNTSDYVRHLIRRDRERAEAVQVIQHAIDEGVQSGAPAAFDYIAFKTQLHKEYGKK